MFGSWNLRNAEYDFILQTSEKYMKNNFVFCFAKVIPW